MNNPADEVLSLIDYARKEALSHLPKWGTPVADLTPAERTALYIHAGVRMETVMPTANTMGWRLARKVTIADRGDGGYIVIEHLTERDELAAAYARLERGE